MNIKNTFKFIFFFMCVGFYLNTSAQDQVDNSDFENWDNIGTDDERPTDWNNMMNGDLGTLAAIGQQQTTWRSTDTHSGSNGTYSVKIKTGDAFSIPVNGTMTLGKLHAPSANPAEGYNQTDRSDSLFNQPFTTKPDSLVVWVKYSVTTPSDSARVSAIIHDDYDLKDPADSTSQTHIVATAIKNFQTNNQWTRLSIPFDYINSSLSPAYILVTFTSSYAPGQGEVGATLYVDDLEMIYNPDNEATVAPDDTQNLIENQEGDTLTVTENNTPTSRAWKYSTTSGSGYQAFSSPETGADYIPVFDTAGTYYVVCESDFDGDVVVSNEVEIVVSEFSVAINPSETQNLLENESGNTLSVTESPDVDSRAWKYSTTSGSNYQAFDPAETDTDYIPVFNTAGTYYVICESTIDDISVISNEVKIVVTEEMGVVKSAYKNVQVYNNAQGITVDLTGSNLKDASIKIFDLTGKLITSKDLSANSLNAIHIQSVEGIYLYKIMSPSGVLQGKFILK